MAESGRAVITRRLTGQGYTDSYATLVHLAALTADDAGMPVAATAQEQLEWDGYFKGLRGALHCLAMHEMQLAPKQAAVVVTEQIGEAVVDLQRRRDTGR